MSSTLCGYKGVKTQARGGFILRERGEMSQGWPGPAMNSKATGETWCLLRWRGARGAPRESAMALAVCVGGWNLEVP